MVLELNSTHLIGALSASVLAISLTFYYYYKNKFSYWQLRGIQGPQPIPIFGNMIQLFTKLRFEREKKWRQEYGRVYGLYEGTKPVLLVADAELARQICIKDFDVFPNHAVNNELSNELQETFLFNLSDDHWRRVRSIMSATFTSGKMRRMFNLLNACADDLVDSFGEQIVDKSDTSALVNLKDLFNLYTMDAIATCCYGLKMERQRGSKDLKSMAKRNEFVHMALKLFDLRTWRIILYFSVSSKLLKLFKFNFVPNNDVYEFANRIEQLIEKRKNSNKRFDDYLQILLDTKQTCQKDQVENNELDSKENHHIEMNEMSTVHNLNGTSDISIIKHHPLSDVEILSSATFLLVVGLETTATLLTHCTYALAHHEDIQDRLREEVKLLAKNNSNICRNYFDYDSITACQYLDAVICETLRLLSPALQTDRKANEDYYIEKLNLTLPKGSKVVLNLNSIMNDPNYWFEPEKFNPDRFLPKNRDKIQPGSYCPFGLGPRHCLGMRFSLTEAKLGLASLLMEFKFKPAPGLGFPPKIRAPGGLLVLKNPNVIVTRLTEYN